MKKLALFLLIFLMAVMGLSCMVKPTAVAKDNGAIVQLKNMAPLSFLPKEPPPQNSHKAFRACITSC